MVTVANVQTYGGWLQLTPAASPTDGLFDVFVMHGATKREILASLLRRHLRIPGSEAGTHVYRGRRASVVASGAPRYDLELVPGVLPVLVSPETRRAVRPRARPGGRRLPGATPPAGVRTLRQGRPITIQTA